MPEQGGVARALDNKTRATYRLTRYSVVWVLAFVTLVPYEIWAIATGKPGGPLTHVVKWAYGPQETPRWWLLGFASTGFITWLIPHFLFEGWGLRSLLILTSTGLLAGATGYLITR